MLDKMYLHFRERRVTHMFFTNQCNMTMVQK